MQTRQLGKTDLHPTLLGMGGFHLIETPQKEATDILNSYLDRGGNYIETAADYGDGLSEKKIGAAISHRRADFILASKCGRRTKTEAEDSIKRSLHNLITDHLDILFMHAVQTEADAEQILAKGGAIHAALAAQKAGLIRYIAISGHGYPYGLLRSIEEFDYDILMTHFNYFDQYNYPIIDEKLVPLCREKGVGLIGMKALADGWLYRSPEPAISFALNQPIATLALGINRMDYLQKDWEVIDHFEPMTEEELKKLKNDALELNDYVCRQCKTCNSPLIKPSDIFAIEGEFDRQMDDGRISDAANFALRERLKHWFQQADSARKRYAAYDGKVDPSQDFSFLNMLCPHNIDIDRKLKLAHAKLSGDYIF